MTEALDDEPHVNSRNDTPASAVDAEQLRHRQADRIRDLTYTFGRIAVDDSGQARYCGSQSDFNLLRGSHFSTQSRWSASRNVTYPRQIDVPELGACGTPAD